MDKALRRILAGMVLALAVAPLGAQVLVQILGGIKIIAYCATPGYPSAPNSTNLEGWWPAKNALCSGLACSNGGSVTSVTDSSTNANTLTLTTGTVTYNSGGGPSGKPYLSFDSTAYFTMAKKITNSDLYSVYVVINFASISAADNSLFGDPSDNQALVLTFLNTNQFAFGNQVGFPSPFATPGPSTGAWHQINGVIAGGSSGVFRLDRASAGSNGFAFDNPTGSKILGWEGSNAANRLPFGGKWADGFIASTNNNSTVRTANECYIYGQYGI